MLVDGDDGDAEFTNDEVTSPGSSVTYLVTIDNDSNVAVTIESLLDNTYPDVECIGPDGDVVGSTLAADDGDGTGALDGGDDEVQCTYTQTAPETSGQLVTNTVTVVVADDSGNADADQDPTKFTVS
jgi:hypothetical protein